MVGVFWLPFGLVRGLWPGNDWGSAVVTLAFTYILGILLQGFATSAIPPGIVKASDGHYRYPSETVLDARDLTLGVDKHPIAQAVKKELNIDIQLEASESLAVDLERRRAFLSARRMLIAQKSSDVVDQFEGLYALMRGLVAALAVAFVYFTGWSAAVFQRNWSLKAAIILTTVGLLAAINAAAMLLRPFYSLATRRRIEKLCAVAILCAFAGIGYGLGLKYQITAAHAAALSVFAAGTLLGALRSYAAYVSFAYHFAVTVWRDFLAWNMLKEDLKNRREQPDLKCGKRDMNEFS